MRIDSLNNTVIKNGFCIGCGICTVTKSSPYNIELGKYGMYQAKWVNIKKDNRKSLEVCPFYSDINEDKIAKLSFEHTRIKHNQHIGYYSQMHAGYVKDESYRLSSSSGGLVSWTLEQLLNNNLIDAIIHVKQSNEKPILFEYSISTTLNEIREGKKSRYYPIELSQILKEIKGKTKRYAVVGIPCFIKGLRLLALKEKEYSNLKYFIGIICGQLKSTYFSNLFAAQYNVTQPNLEGIDFRVKIPNTTASHYAVELKYFKDGKIISTISKPARYLFGSDWGMGMFKYKACDVCDDVYNETADIVFGDAWVEPYFKDWKGTNLIIIRNSIFSNIFEKGKTENEIYLSNINEEEALYTQLPSIRHRRETIGYRLFHFKKDHDWIPNKRFKPSNDFDKRTVSIQNLRLKINEKSHRAMQLSMKYNSFVIFLVLMKPYVIAYNYQRFGFLTLILSPLIKLGRKFTPSFITKWVRKILKSLYR